MIVSRGLFTLQVGKKICRTLCRSKEPKNLNQIRWSSHNVKFLYRTFKEMPKNEERVLKYTNAMVWWWVLWHLFTEYDELVGPFMPNPAHWTDEELGIPAD